MHDHAQRFVPPRARHWPVEAGTGCGTPTRWERLRGLRSDRSAQRASRRAGAAGWRRLDVEPRDGVRTPSPASGCAASAHECSEPRRGRALPGRSGARHLLGPAERTRRNSAAMVEALVRLAPRGARATEPIAASLCHRAGMSPDGGAQLRCMPRVPAFARWSIAGRWPRLRRSLGAGRGALPARCRSGLRRPSRDERPVPRS
jgi:hypothetical protein